MRRFTHFTTIFCQKRKQLKSTDMQTNASRSKKIVKKDLIRRWLLQGYPLTARQASQKFGADRMSDIVLKLRREGMNIQSFPLESGKDRFMNPVHFSKYRWLGETPMICFDHDSRNVKIYYFHHQYPMTAAMIKKHIIRYCENMKAKVKQIGYVKLKDKTLLPRLLVKTTKGQKLFVIKAGKWANL
jgi:hypothetical protein